MRAQNLNTHYGMAKNIVRQENLLDEDIIEAYDAATLFHYVFYFYQIMPNKHAAIKDLRKNRRRAAQNLKIKTNVKSLYKNSVALIKEGKLKEAQELAQRFQQAVDKAVNKHILSKNAASRKKATLMKSANPKK